jgi:hypothetical protein
MRGMQPWKLIAIGFVLVLFGAVAPFLMVMKVVPSSFILNFLSYGASVVGLFLGLIGAALYVRIHRG